MERTMTIVANIRETLERMLGESFTGLEEKAKNNMIVVMLYKLAEQDKEIMGMIANDMFKQLQSEI